MNAKTLNQIQKLVKRNTATLARLRTQLEIAEQIGRDLESAVAQGGLTVATAKNAPRKA